MFSPVLTVMIEDEIWYSSPVVMCSRSRGSLFITGRKVEYVNIGVCKLLSTF
jgi:hypothetical protein